MYNQWNTAGGPQQCGPAQARFERGKFGRFGNPQFGGGYKRPKYNVPVNIADTESAFEVYVYATGFAKDNIKISITDDVLYVTGTATPDENNLPNFLRQEYPIKSFERRIGLHESVDKAAISARHTDGVLIITLPKSKDAAAPSQEIKVD